MEVMDFRKQISDDQVKSILEINKKLRAINKEFSFDILELKDKTAINPMEKIGVIELAVE